MMAYVHWCQWASCSSELRRATSSLTVT